MSTASSTRPICATIAIKLYTSQTASLHSTVEWTAEPLAPTSAPAGLCPQALPRLRPVQQQSYRYASSIGALPATVSVFSGVLHGLCLCFDSTAGNYLCCTRAKPRNATQVPGHTAPDSTGSEGFFVVPASDVSSQTPLAYSESRSRVGSSGGPAAVRSKVDAAAHDPIAAFRLLFPQYTETSRDRCGPADTQQRECTCGIGMF